MAKYKDHCQNVDWQSIKITARIMIGKVARSLPEFRLAKYKDHRQNGDWQSREITARMLIGKVATSLPEC